MGSEVINKNTHICSTWLVKLVFPQDMTRIRGLPDEQTGFSTLKWHAFHLGTLPTSAQDFIVFPGLHIHALICPGKLPKNPAPELLLKLTRPFPTTLLTCLSTLSLVTTLLLLLEGKFLGVLGVCGYTRDLQREQAHHSVCRQPPHPSWHYTHAADMLSKVSGKKVQKGKGILNAFSCNRLQVNFKGKLSL